MTQTNTTSTLREWCRLVLALCASVAVTVGLTAQTFPGSTTNTAGNNLIPSAGTGGCGVAPQTTTGTIFPLTVAGLPAGTQIANVSITATHTWASDLDIYLQSPTGQVISLSSGNGGTTGLDAPGTIVFSPVSTTPITTWVGGPPMGPYLAQGATVFPCATAPIPNTVLLDALTPSNGTWNLIFYDAAGGDSGTLQGWSITFAAPPTCSITCPPNISVNADATVCGAVLTIPNPVTDPTCVGTQTFTRLSSGVQPLAGGTTLTATGFTIAFPATPATGPVQICFDYTGDFGDATEAVQILSQNGTLILTTATGGDCTTQQVCVTISAATYNTTYAGTTQTFTLQPDAQVNPQLCGNDEGELSFNLPAGVVLVTNNITGNAPIVNFQFQVGTTQVIFTTRNSLGAPVRCTTLVTVTDVTAPVFTNCPAPNTVLTIGQDACDVTFSFIPNVTDNCGDVIGLSAGRQNIFNVADTNAAGIDARRTIAGQVNSLAQVYDFTNINTNQTLRSFGFFAGVSSLANLNITENDALTIRYYSLPSFTAGTAPDRTMATLIATSNVILPAGTTGFETFDFPQSVVIPGAVNYLLVEVIDDAFSAVQFPLGMVARNSAFGSFGSANGGAFTNLQSLGNNADVPWILRIASTAVVQIGGPSLVSGNTVLGPGSTSFSFRATDISGNVSVCAFTVQVNPAVVNNGAIVINPRVQASLDPLASCSFVTTDMLLEGSGYGCLDSFRITRSPAVAPGFGCPTGPVYLGAVPITCADIGRPVRVTVTDPVSGNSQWGLIIVEDKTAPVFANCADITVPCNFDFATAVATPASNETLNFGSVPAFGATGTPDSRTVTRTLNIPANPSGTITSIEVDLDITHTFIGDASVFLTTPDGTRYTLFAQQCGAGDNALVTFAADGNAFSCALTAPVIRGRLRPATPFATAIGTPANGNYVLRLEDAFAGDAFILNSAVVRIGVAGFAPTPTVTDNCPGVTVQTLTSNTNGTCATDRVLIRTFIATDASGNTAACTQRVTFERPTLADIDFPVSLDGISGQMLDCTSAFPAIGARVTFNSTALVTPGTPIVDGGSVQVPITLTGFPTDAQFTDLNVGLGLDYTSPQQVIASFGRQFNPNPVLLFQTACDINGVAGVDDLVATFDDSGVAAFDCATFAPVIQGTYRPASPLTAFNGQAVNGTYILTISDFFADPFNPDLGALDSLRLTFKYSTALAITSPTIGGRPINQLACQLNLTTDERVIDVCPTSYKVRRVFTALDMCTGAELVSTQIITVMDQTGPILNAPRSTPTNQINLIAISTQVNTNQISGYGPCLGDVVIPPITIVGDDCSGAATFSTEIYSVTGTLLGVNSANGGLFTGLPLIDGVFISALVEPDISYRVRYLVDDNCGNQTATEVFYNVIERTAPVADCDQITSVNITGTDTTFVPASVFDDGSYDVCGDVHFYARRMRPTGDLVPYGNYFESDNLKTFVPFKFRETVPFTCADASVMVYFLVVDDFVQGYLDFTTSVTIPNLPAATRNNPNTPYTIRADGTFFLSTANAIGGRTKDVWEGHYNLCMVEARVSDKVAPVLVTPVANRTLSCVDRGLIQQYADVTNLTFDAPRFQDNCTFTVSLTVNDGTSTCGDGVITRTFRATDPQGNQSVIFTQRITVLAEHDYTILFPDDLDIRNCVFGAGQNDTLTEDRLIERDCDLLAVSHTDVLFTADDDACYKILRTYDVINWCEWNGIDAAINITNPNATLAGPRLDVTVSTAGVEVVRVNGQLQNFGSVGRWSYVQIIKVYDTVDPTLVNVVQAPCTPAAVVALPAGGCAQTVSVSFDLADNCATEFNVSYRLVAFAGPGTSPTTGLPVRAVTVADLALGTSFPIVAPGFGDPFGGTITGRTRNAQGVFVDVPAGRVTISGTFPLGNHVLVVTINDQCGNIIERYVPFTARDCKAPTIKVYNGLAVNIMQTGMVPVPVRMFDNGAFDACSAVKLSYSANVNDTVRVFTCADLGSVLIRVYGTDAAGNQDFVETYLLVQDNVFNVCTGPAPRIAARLTTDAGDGVGGAAVKVSGDATMSATSAADGTAGFAVTAGGDYSVSALLEANPANGVSTYDLSLIGKHILGTAPLTTFWQRTAADANGNGSISAYDMTVIRRVILGLDPAFRGNTSWRFFNATDNTLEVVNVNDAIGVSAANFLAVKIGDVNGSARANDRQVLAPRTVAGEFALVADDARLVAGESQRVVFGASDLTATGYQLTLEWDASAVEVTGVEALTHDAAGFGTHLLSEGKLTLSYAGEMTDAMFALEVRALRGGVVLSEALTVTSTVTAAEAYDAAAELNTVALRFNGANGVSGYVLEQNRPNPFAQTTVIGFTMAAEHEAALTVTDIAGRVVWRTKGVFAAGRNVVEIAGDELPTGVLNYTLTAGDFTATRKMIVLE